MAKAALALFLIAALVAGCAQEQAAQDPTGQVPSEEPMAPEAPAPQAPAEAPMEEPAEVPGESPAMGGEPDVTFALTGVNFRFEMEGQANPTLRVKQGDLVRIEFASNEGLHDWVVDEFGVRTEQVRPGTPTFVEFVADEAGTFAYYCSVGSHRQMGMEGQLIVE